MTPEAEFEGHHPMSGGRKHTLKSRKSRSR